MEAQQSSAGKLLRIEEVADRMAVSRQHVYRLIQRKELATVTIGIRKIRVAEADLEDFFNRNRSHTQS